MWAVQRLNTEEMEYEEWLAELESPLYTRRGRVSARVAEMELAQFKSVKKELGA